MLCLSFVLMRCQPLRRALALLGEQMKSGEKCPICSSFRELPHHLYELSEFCRFLNNHNEYKRRGESRIVETKVISDWLKLAAELEVVEINSWRFGDDTAAMYCRPVADEYESNSKHFTAYSTALTRFIFVSNALEEAYRFVDSHYLMFPSVVKLDERKKLRDASLRSAFLVDQLKETALPLNFKHAISNLRLTFEYYHSIFQTSLSGMKGVETTDNSYGLHLVRNLRNHVAHGIFPILDNPEYWGSSEISRTKLIALLFHACRVAALYIQALLHKYNDGFQHDDYDHIASMDWDDCYEQHFIKNCTVDLSLSLHSKCDFSFENPYGYKC
ncbi:hypothetical protein DLR71_15205 [Vibrio paracholerae]|nr:hypothetical protein DLR71_15205 [Vibrio paracholerae]